MALNNMSTSGMLRYGDFLFRYRNMIFPAVLIMLLVGFRPGTGFGGGVNNIYPVLAGIAIVVFGQLIRSMVIGLAYIKRGGMNKKVYADTLVISGIFSHCRNPLYLGNLMIVFGLTLMHNNYTVFLLCTVFFLVSYIAIVMAEERFLRGKFGQEYDDYCSQTSRWLFRFKGLANTLGNSRFDWRRVIFKDYTTILTWAITLDLVLAEKALYRDGFENYAAVVMTYSVPIMIMMVAGVLVRMIKKSPAHAGTG